MKISKVAKQKNTPPANGLAGFLIWLFATSFGWWLFAASFEALFRGHIGCARPRIVKLFRLTARAH